MAAGGTEGRPTVPARVFCDTSYFYACADTDDIYHRQALAMAGEAVSRGSLANGTTLSERPEEIRARFRV